MTNKKVLSPNLVSSNRHCILEAPLTTDLNARYGVGATGQSLEQQLTQNLIRRMAFDIGRKRQSMTSARALKDHQLRSMVSGLTQLVITGR